MRISTTTLHQNAVNAILDEQAILSRTQNQISSGKRVQNAADDPVAAVQIAQLTDTKAQFTQYTSNGQAATTRLTFESQALSDSTTTLQSIRDLVVQANSGSNNVGDLKQIASQIQSLEQQLQSVANRQDAQGEYLFSGFSGGTQPFVRSGGGSVTYAGDAGSRRVALDSGTTVQMGDAGSTVFMNVAAGNDTFTTAASAANTGAGVIDTGSVTSPSAWAAGDATYTPPYTITFTDASHWKVTDSGGTAVTDAGGNPVTSTYDGSGGTIAFNGIQVGISGAPAAGDTFTVAAAGQQDVFTTLDKLVGSLNGATSGAAARAQLSSSLAGSLQQIDQAMGQISTVSSNVGARINLVSSVATSLTVQSTTVTAQISNLGDLDYVSATSQLSQQYVGLQAAESSYAQIAQLSLFKYL